MRIAILSDIHGNFLALDKALDDLRREPVDRIICLGDEIQGGPQPVQVVARLRELGCGVVMGNSDAWLLTGEETGEENISDERRLTFKAIRDWTLSQLSSSDHTFIQAFKTTIEVDLEAGRKLLCFHGSPASVDDVILPDIAQDALFRFLGSYNADIMTGGHTDVQFMRRIDSGACPMTPLTSSRFIALAADLIQMKLSLKLPAGRSSSASSLWVHHFLPLVRTEPRPQKQTGWPNRFMTLTYFDG